MFHSILLCEFLKPQTGEHDALSMTNIWGKPCVAKVFSSLDIVTSLRG